MMIMKMISANKLPSPKVGFCWLFSALFSLLDFIQFDFLTLLHKKIRFLLHAGSPDVTSRMADSVINIREERNRSK